MRSFPKSIWAILAAIVLMILGVLGIVIVNNDNEILESTPYSQSIPNEIKVVINDGVSKEKTFTVNTTTAESLENLLVKLDNESSDINIEYQEFDYGKMIYKINNQAPRENEFWNIKLNNADAQVGIKDLKVKPSDEVKLTITSFE